MIQFQVREGTVEDVEFVVSLVPRLVEFGPPSWRDPRHMMATDCQVLTDALGKPAAGAAVFIAESAGRRLGFIHLNTSTDYYTREQHGHIADLVVAPEGEGQGVAGRLMEQAERWSRDQGFRWLTLSVFAENTHAREVYERRGYRPDIFRYLKVLE